MNRRTFLHTAIAAGTASALDSTLVISNLLQPTSREQATICRVRGAEPFDPLQLLEVHDGPPPHVDVDALRAKLYHQMTEMFGANFHAESARMSMHETSGRISAAEVRALAREEATRGGVVALGQQLERNDQRAVAHLIDEDGDLWRFA